MEKQKTPIFLSEQKKKSLIKLIREYEERPRSSECFECKKKWKIKNQNSIVKLPLWMWLVHEGSGMLMNVAHGIMLAVIGVAIMSIALPTVSRIMSNNDTIIQNFCNSYEKNQKIK